MQFFSPYEQMIRDAARIPQGENAKLIMRHSIREDNPVNGDYEPLLLTKEGIVLAQTIGESLDRQIGSCVSSRVKRCIQTAECISNAASAKNGGKAVRVEIAPVLSQCLGNPQPKERGGVGWFEYFHYLQEGDTEMTRGITLLQEAVPFIDCLFSYGGEPGELDLFSTHDSTIVILASALFGLKTGIHGESWCRYTEGMFLYGTRKNFTALWRGEERQFVKYGM